MSNNIINLTNETFDKIILKSDKPVVVDFWATWCGPCRIVGPVMEELANKYDGRVQIAKVNVDEQGELAAKFKIMSIPTILAFKNGELAEKTVGARSKDEFSEMIDKLL